MQVTLDYVAVRHNKDGTVRYYFKRQGQPVTRLHGEPMSEQFLTQYRACLAWVAPDNASSEDTSK